MNRRTLVTSVSLLAVLAFSACGGGGTPSQPPPPVILPLTITTTSLPSGLAGKPYSATLTASGGTAPYTWSVAQGYALPSGLTLSTGGAISGTPTTRNVTVVQFSVADSSSPQKTASSSYSIQIDIDLAITSHNLPDGVAGKPYSATLTGSGGTPPYTWVLSPSSWALPEGLSLSPAGVISGTPVSPSNTGHPITLTDSSSISVTDWVYLYIDTELVITTATLLDAHANIAYSSFIQSNSGRVRLWTVTSGTIPPGMQLTNFNGSIVQISGTCTQPGTYDFTLKAETDNNPPQVATRSFTLTVDNKAAISTTTLPDMIRTKPYSATLTAVNGTPPYHFSATSSTLPPGISVSGAGVISGSYTGIPNSTYAVSFQVTDSAASPTSTDTTLSMYSIEVLQADPNQNYTAVKDQWANINLVAQGGRYPYTFTITSGTLPPGLTLADIGYISGTPTQAGSFSFDVKVEDSTNPHQTATFTAIILVNPPPLSMPVSLPAKIPQGVAFSGFVATYGGTPPYTWSRTSGSLPPGLTLNTSTGEISGTPTTVGVYNFAIRAVDSGSPQQSGSINEMIEVVAAKGRNDSIQNATPIGNGSFSASISPYADPVDTANPDFDYYKITIDPAQAVTFTTYAKIFNSNNPLDSVIEIVDVNGVRLNSCNPPDSPNGSFSSPCLNDDIVQGVQRDSTLYLKVPGQSGVHQTVYLRVFDWGGSARPDMVYMLSVTGAVSP